MYRTKRLGDVVVAALLLLVLSPLFLAIVGVVWLRHGRPVIFSQRRPGIDGHLFTLYKFRTMRDPRPGEAAWTSDSVRVTALGRVLRRTSLDELPELWNVLKGDMSLVGPRPLLQEYLHNYSTRQALRHTVRPGITGLAQVSGRRSLTLGQRLELDVQYLERWSFWLDLSILIRTLVVPFAKGDDPDQNLKDVDDVGFFATEDDSLQPGGPRWEVGSFFHTYRGQGANDEWLPVPHVLLATGRQAISAAFVSGQIQYGWRRLFLPEFYCPDVIAWLSRRMPTTTYPCDPVDFRWPENAHSSDAVLAISYFGNRPPFESAPPQCGIILDVTHDPLAEWVANSSADYAIASLRKTLPVPDGAVLWSPTHTPIDLQTDLEPEHRAALIMHQAMEMKADYLIDKLPSNEMARRLFVEAEVDLMGTQTLHQASETTRRLLARLPATNMRSRRLEAVEKLQRLVSDHPGLEVWPNNFGGVFLFRNKITRDSVRGALIDGHIYPAILWEPNPNLIRSESWDFGNRMLHIHADYLHSSQDLHRIAQALTQNVNSLETTSHA